MALERQAIVKTDFPIGRRGYDPAAVDAHLNTIADEIEVLKDTPEGRSQPVATAISEQVRGIVEAAEKGAAEIQARAQQEARQMKAEASRTAKRERQQATKEAKQEREQAAEQAREYVGRVSQSAARMLQQLDAIEGELDTLTASLRSGADRLKGELERIDGDLAELAAATASEFATEDEPLAAEETEATAAKASEPLAAETGAAEPEPVQPVAVEEAVPATESGKIGDRPPEELAEVGPERGATQPEEEAVEVPPDEPEGVATVAGSDDSEGARLIALNMALNGTPREETDRYLAENFSLHDRSSLLDEVYASVEG